MRKMLKVHLRQRHEILPGLGWILWIHRWRRRDKRSAQRAQFCLDFWNDNETIEPRGVRMPRHDRVAAVPRHPSFAMETTKRLQVLACPVRWHGRWPGSRRRINRGTTTARVQHKNSHSQGEYREHADGQPCAARSTAVFAVHRLPIGYWHIQRPRNGVGQPLCHFPHGASTCIEPLPCGKKQVQIGLRMDVVDPKGHDWLVHGHRPLDFTHHVLRGVGIAAEHEHHQAAFGDPAKDLCWVARAGLDVPRRDPALDSALLDGGNQLVGDIGIFRRVADKNTVGHLRVADRIR